MLVHLNQWGKLVDDLDKAAFIFLVVVVGGGLIAFFLGQIGSTNKIIRQLEGMDIKNYFKDREQKDGSKRSK